MQLSLPATLPAAPDATAPGAGTANPAAGHCGPTAAGQTDVPFDSLLPEDKPAGGAATTKVGAEAETAASILASAFWMAVGPLPLPTQPAPSAGDTSATPGVAPQGALAGFPAATAGLFAPRSARDFAAIGADTAAPGRSGCPAGANDPGKTALVSTTTLPAAATDKPDGAVPTMTPADAALVDPSSTKTATPTVGADTALNSISASAVATQAIAGAANAIPARRAGAGEATRKVETTPGASADATDDAIVEITPTGRGTPAGELAAKLKDRAASLAETDDPENIAATLRNPAANVSAKNLPEKKDFLNTDQTAVTARARGVGISVAELAASMSPNPSNRPKSAQTAELAPVVSVSVDKLATVDAPADAPAPATTAREVIAKVVSAVEALLSKEIAGQKSVDLQFRVGDESLALRVELRDGTVHATFRAQSAELRTALAQEWQSVQPVSGREIRIADPVFSSSGGESAFGSLNQGNPHRQTQDAPVPSAFKFAPDNPDADAAEPSPVVKVPANSTQLLSAFA